MDLKKALLADRSKAYVASLARQICSRQDLFDDLWNLVKTEDAPIPLRGSWLMEIAAGYDSELLQPHIAELIEHLTIPYHNSVHRNLAKMLARIEIPEDHQGELYDLCIERLCSPPIHVAIKVHCMTIAFNIAKDIPELKEELALVIRDQMEFNSVGFKARGKNILKKIENKHINSRS